MHIATNTSSGKINISSEKITAEVAKEFTNIFVNGDIVFLIGEMGVGKTTFVRYLINEFQKKNNLDLTEVTSPTFNILNEYQIEAYQKPPNDIYVKDRKIAGILLSNVQIGNSGNYQALSVGININSNIELKELDRNAKANHTSFAKELGKEINREKVLVEIIELLDKVIQKQVNQ